jgi:hypothetical protein
MKGQNGSKKVNFSALFDADNLDLFISNLLEFLSNTFWPGSGARMSKVWVRIK